MLRLNADRTVTAYISDTEVTLRAPTVAEFRKIRDAYLAAEDAQRVFHAEQAAAVKAWEELPDDDPTPPPSARTSDYVWGDGNPYGKAFALAVETLARPAMANLDADALPMWATEASVYTQLHQHWREVQIVRENEPAAAPIEDVPFDPVAAGLAPDPAPRRLPAAVRGHLAAGNG